MFLCILNSRAAPLRWIFASKYNELNEKYTPPKFQKRIDEDPFCISIREKNREQILTAGALQLYPPWLDVQTGAKTLLGSRTKLTKKIFFHFFRRRESRRDY